MTKFHNIRASFSRPFYTTNKFIQKKPFTSFLVLIVLLFSLILASFILNKPVQTDNNVTPPLKKVQVYNAGLTPKVTTNGNVNKDGVVEIFAQTNGIVSNIYKNDGQKVLKGQTLLSIGANYSGSNMASISKQISEKNYLNLKDTYNDRIKIINKNIEIAEESHDNAEDLRDINKSTVNRTEDLIDLNEQILDSINIKIESTSDSEQISNLKNQKSQVLATINGLKSSIESVKNSSKNDGFDEDNNDNVRDVAVKNLEIERKALDLSIQTSKLQLDLAKITESFNHPVSPIVGTVEKVYVKNNETVNAGTKLALVKSANQTATVEVYLNKEIANNVDKNTTHKIYLGTNAIDVKVASISSEPVKDSLYFLSFNIPKEALESIYDDQTVKADINLTHNSSNKYVLLPIDSVFQTQSSANVLIIKKDNDKYKVEAKNVKLGRIFGSYVEVTEGLAPEDEIVLNRDVSAGETVEKA